MPKNKPNDDQISGYQQMIQRIREALTKLDPSSIQQAIQQAKQTAIDTEEYTSEEIEEIAKYVKRDLDDLAAYLQENGREFNEWLRFDVGLLEERIWDAFVSVADQTRLEMLQLNFRLQRGAPYHSGEICSPGTLQCDTCGELLHFKKVAHIPPCAKCHGSVFSRLQTSQ